MYGALRWVESHGGKQIVIIGHRGISKMYKRLGFQSLGFSTQSGALTYDILLGTVSQNSDPSPRNKRKHSIKFLIKQIGNFPFRLPPQFPVFMAALFLKRLAIALIIWTERIQLLMRMFWMPGSLLHRKLSLR